MAGSSLLNDPARAWAPFEPGPGAPWDLPRVAHLHRRAGFAAPWATLQRDLRDGPGPSLDRVLNGEPQAADGRPSSEFDDLADEMARQLAPAASLTRLQAIWLYRMIFTAHPLRERMTLFWHNHFATSQVKVQNGALMQRQNDLFRDHALGDFSKLLAAVGKDPAMLVWLDSTANRKAHPNENYARELMELFTLGRGHYSERDVQEAARAFTGWFVIRDGFQEVAAQHDRASKTILGQTGNFDGDALPAILLAQPACAGFLCTKLVRAFVTEVDPIPPPLIESLAKAFRESGHDIRVPLAMILRSNLFFDSATRRTRIKSPVELAVGTIRALEILKPTVRAEALAVACERMGQSLFAPPSVAGWDGGPAWINSTTLLARTNLVLALLSPDNPELGKRFDPPAVARRHGVPEARFFTELLVQDAFDRQVRETVDASRTPATAVLTSSEYQLA